MRWHSTWAACCALNDVRLLDQVGVLSTISGGSVIGAYYAYTPGKLFSEFEADIRVFLRHGFQRSIALELLKPWNLIGCLGSFMETQLAESIALLTGRETGIVRDLSRSDLFCARFEQRRLWWCHIGLASSQWSADGCGCLRPPTRDRLSLWKRDFG